MAIAGAPIFAGGSAATLIMTSTLKEMNLTTAATFCIVLYVTQKFIGVPIASLLLRRTARLIRDDAMLVEQYSTLQEENDAAHHGPLHLPKCCERPFEMSQSQSRSRVDTTDIIRQIVDIYPCNEQRAK